MSQLDTTNDRSVKIPAAYRRSPLWHWRAVRLYGRCPVGIWTGALGTLTEDFCGFLQSFKATATIWCLSGRCRWPTNSVHFIIPQLFWRSTVCIVRHTVTASKMCRTGDTSLCASFHFQTRSQNCEKRLLPSSWLSVRPSATTRLPLDRFSWNLLLEYFSDICWGNSNFFKIGKE